MSAPLPIIDVDQFFNDPSIPDGPNVGFVAPDGTVFREGKAVGVDSKHPRAKAMAQTDRLLSLSSNVPPMPIGSIQSIEKTLAEMGTAKANQEAIMRISAPKRELVKLYDAIGHAGVDKVGIDNRGDAWLLSGGKWYRLLPANLPPLPQE